MAFAALTAFATTFTRQINAIYKENPLRALKSQIWPGAICLPFIFGDGKVDWSGADDLKDKLDNLLHEQRALPSMSRASPASTTASSSSF